MHQVPSDPRTVVILADFDSMSPELVFEHLTRPELVVKWWPEEAESEAREGGKFVYRWPEKNDWTLRGEFRNFEASKHLAFTWHWDHEPGGEHEQLVRIWLERFSETGTRIGIFHGEFREGKEGEADRQGVAEGWIHFMMRLAGLSHGNAGE